jgi:hypothetical protein
MAAALVKPCSKILRDIRDCKVKDLRPRKRGRKGGVLARLRRRFTKPPLPSIVIANTQSLTNKLDEIRVHCRHDSVYREACLLAFSETWLNDNIPDAEAAISGFTLVRGDRSLADSGKHGGGGVCVYVNNGWCNDITVH